MSQRDPRPDRSGRQVKRPWRGPTLLEIHRAHLRNYGTFLALAEEEYPEDVDRVLAWRNSVTPDERCD